MKHILRTQLGLGFAAVLLTASLGACSGETGDPYADAVKSVAANDYAAARLYITQALKDHPENKQARFLSGQIALESGNPDRAIADFSALLADPAFAEKVKIPLARAYLMGGNAKLALATLGDTLPQDGKAYAVAAGAHLAMGAADKAALVLDEGLGKFADSLDLRALDGDRALASGDTARAKAIAAQLVQEHPENVESHLFAGRVAMLSRDLTGAEEHFKTVIKLRPRYLSALLSLSAIAHDKGDASAAKEWLEKAQGIAPKSPVVVYMAAQTAYDAGKTDDAMKLIQTLDEQAGQFPALTMLSGLVDARRGNSEQAIAKLRSYVDDGGDDGRGRYALALLLSNAGDAAGAWKALAPIAKAQNADGPTLQLAAKLTQGSDPAAHAGFAARLAQLQKPDPNAKDMIAAGQASKANNWQKADEIYTALLAKTPQPSVILLNNAANAKVHNGQAAAAVGLARQALAAAPDDAIVLDTLAWALFKANGKSPEVTGLIQQAAAAAPANGEIREHWNVITHSK